jgi:cobaltochelatase CobN
LIFYLSTADTELLTLSHAVRRLPDGFVGVRGANLTGSGPEAVDALLEQIESSAELVILRLLGGKRAFEAGFERLERACRERRALLIALPGDQQPDLDLAASTTVPADVAAQVFEYLLHGGVDNFCQLLRYASDQLLGSRHGWQPPKPLPWYGLYHPQLGHTDLETLLGRRGAENPTVAIVFYRAHWMSGNLEFVDALVRRLEALGANALPAFCYSLKDESAEESGTPGVFRDLLLDAQGTPRFDCLINTLSFSMGKLTVEGPTVAGGWSVDFLNWLDRPILQAVLATSTTDQWETSPGGLNPIDTAMNVAMPEFDGRIITVPISFKEAVAKDERTGASLQRYAPRADRVDLLARLALAWARLRRTPSSQKRVALVLANYPTKNARIGNAVGLDTPASVINILSALRAAGYSVGEIPETGDALIHELIETCSYDREFLTDQQAERAVGKVTASQYREWFDGFTAPTQAQLREHWGEPPGEVYCYSSADGQIAASPRRSVAASPHPPVAPSPHLIVPGLVFGNVFVGIQPPRGFGDNPIAIYHSPDLPPTHHYLGVYRWIRDVFGAHAVINVGKHGTLEWTPGKAVGLSAECYPELALQDLPNFYPFVVNDPGEGVQAKRRSHATIVDHLIPPMQRAESYSEITQLEQLMDEYYQVQTLDPKKLPLIRKQIWSVVTQARLDRDLHADDQPDDFDGFLLHLDGYICELKDAQIRDGLHVLGQVPQGEQLVNLLLAMTRLENFGVPSLRASLARALGIDYDGLLADRGALYEADLPPVLAAVDAAAARSNGDVIERLDTLGKALLERLAQQSFEPEGIPEVLSRLQTNCHSERSEECETPRRHTLEILRSAQDDKGESAQDDKGESAQDDKGESAQDEKSIRNGHEVARVLDYAARQIYRNLLRTTDEIANLLRGLDGGYVPAGPSGAPTRGMANVLPTGRNFYAVDPNSIPSPVAWEVGKGLADALIQKYLDEEGEYPKSVGLVVWGTSAMRTHGDDVAQILQLLGVRPIWQPENRRVRGLEVVPLKQLGRPRIDVTIRISGFFRDAFPNLVHLLDQAVEQVAVLEEPDEQNFVAAHYRAELAARLADGQEPGAAAERARYRLFGSKPGTYGAGILPLLDQRNWNDDHDLARVYAAWGGYAYTRQSYGQEAIPEFETRFGQIVVAAKNQDNREHDIFDSDDYLQFHGGMIATVRALTGQNPREFFGDSSDPARVKIRDLADEARRVVRSRVINPHWIESIKRHGYKGAFELAATVDYLYGYDATARIGEDWMYERVTQAYVFDDDTQRFLKEKNPWALRGIIERLQEAIDRGLWQEPDPETQRRLRRLYLELEGELEERG